MAEKKLGVIGGMGPMATAHFLERVITMTDAPADQDHLEMIVYNVPAIPDRTGYILGKSTENPLPLMIRIGRKLAQESVHCLAIPCITAHYFYDELAAAISRPILHAIRETAAVLKHQAIRTVGLIATDGTLESGLFQNELARWQIRCVLPGAGLQQAVMQLIYQNIKSGLPVDLARFAAVSADLRQNGAETIILGCSELSLLRRDNTIGPGYLDVMDVLARSAIMACDKPVRKDFACLIT